MPMTRRDAMVLATGTVAACGLNAVPAWASAVDEAIAAFTGGAEPGEGGVVLNVPEIAGERQCGADRRFRRRRGGNPCRFHGESVARRGHVQVRPACGLVLRIDPDSPCKEPGRDRGRENGRRDVPPDKRVGESHRRRLRRVRRKRHGKRRQTSGQASEDGSRRRHDHDPDADQPQDGIRSAQGR